MSDGLGLPQWQLVYVQVHHVEIVAAAQAPAAAHEQMASQSAAPLPLQCCAGGSGGIGFATPFCVLGDATAGSSTCQDS